MENKRVLTSLVLLIAVLAVIATITGIISKGGPGPFEHVSVRGERVEIYGRGLYRDMPADVAIQGIAQDYVTLFWGIPLLLVGLVLYRRGSMRGKLLLAGVLQYFTLTYLFYLAMAMYNEMFLVYVALLFTSLLSYILILLLFDYKQAGRFFSRESRVVFAGYVLLINSLLIALLWFNVILPPLFDGTLYPQGLAHMTTAIVQGFDLSIFLPLGIISALLAIRRNGIGFILTTINILFLSVLMAALSAKVFFMAAAGQNVIPVIFLIPSIALIALLLSGMLLKLVVDK